MKSNLNHLFIGIALLSFAFVACDKNEQTEDPQGHVIQDGKILLTAGYQPPVSDSKYTFNIFYNVCYFDKGDSIYVNGAPYAVFPYDAGGDDESDDASSWARVWVDTNSTGLYKGLYPKSAFASSITDYENPTVIMPRRVKSINYKTYEPAVSINAPEDGRVIPTTAFATTANFNDSMVFRNTLAMLCFKLRYHANFARCIDPSATQASGWPEIVFDSIRLITPNHPMSGMGYIHNPYTTTPSTSEPLLTLNAGGNDTISYYFMDSDTMGPKAGNPSNPGTVTAIDIAFAPIIAMNSTPTTVEIHFTAKLNDGTLKHYVYTKSNTLYTTRNMITTVYFHFLTNSDFNSYCHEK